MAKLRAFTICQNMAAGFGSGQMERGSSAELI